MIFLLEFVHVFIISLMLCVCAICGLISFSRDGEIWFEHESPDEWFERIIRERKKQRNNFLLTLVVTVIIIGGVLHSINNIHRTHIEPKKWVQVYKNSIDAKIKVENLFDHVVTPKTVITHDDIKNKGTIYQFTPPTTYCIYENIKKDDFRFGSRLFNFNSCSLLKSCAFYIIVGNFQGQFFHLKTTV